MCRLPIFTAILALSLSLIPQAYSESTKGAEILAPFKQDLQQALMNGLSEGPVNAIDACRLKAPEIAANLSHNGIRVGRTSDRLRNPSNTSPEWAISTLKLYTEDSSQRSPKTVTLDNDRSGYIEPIIIQPVCLACHGQNLSADVSLHISKAYPEDQATGYKLGDLRGIFWAEFPN